MNQLEEVLAEVERKERRELVVNVLFGLMNATFFVAAIKYIFS